MEHIAQMERQIQDTISENERLCFECETHQRLLAWAYSKLAYRSFDSMEDALAMDEIKLILMGGQA